MARVLVDTNLWARRLERGSPLYWVARDAMRRLHRRGDQLVIVPQTLYELWVVMTRPANSRGGLGKTPEEAARLLAACAGMGEFLPDSAAIYPLWLHLVKGYGVAGARAHDARLVAAMLAGNVSHILTFNGSDFAAFVKEGIQIIDPKEF